MNIHKCSKGRMKGNLYCAFMVLERDSNNRLVESGCRIKNKDIYNIYPEHDAYSGEVIFNNKNPSDPWKIGPNLIWENQTDHQNGLQFDFRSFPADAEWAPTYSVLSQERPTKSGLMGPEDIGEVFGDSHFTLTSTGWSSTRVKGIPYINTCMKAIYGKWNDELQMVIPKCLRNFVGILPNFNNFTRLRITNNQNKLFLEIATDDDIYNFCSEWIENPRARDQIFITLKEIKTGKFINLKEILSNNHLDQDIITGILSNVSTLTFKSVYTSKINLENYINYFDSLNSFNLTKENLFNFRCNLVNYILNYPGLYKKDYEHDKYKNDEKVWLLKSLLQRAINCKILSMDTKISEIIVYKIAILRRTKIFKHRTGNVTLKDATEQIKSDIAEALAYGLKEPYQLYPAMIKIEDLLNLTEDVINSPMYKTFGSILKAGRRWNSVEIKTAWDYYIVSYYKKDPLIFWNFIQSVIEMAYEDANTTLMTEDGAMNYTRSFALNLEEARRNEEPLSYEVHEAPLQNWYEANARRNPIAQNFNQKAESCWIALAGKSNTLGFNTLKALLPLIAKDDDDLLDLTDALYSLKVKSLRAGTQENISTNLDENLEGISELDIFDGSNTNMMRGDSKWEVEE